VKPSQRRAVDEALARLRCPSCNRLRLARSWSQATGQNQPRTRAGCGSCGWYGPYQVTFTDRATPAGHKTIATVTTGED
jgi:RNase P subunit RPR2